MPPPIELAFNKPFVLLERNPKNGLRLLNNAMEMGMTPTLVGPGKHRSSIGTTVTVGPENLGLIFTDTAEIKALPSLLQSTNTELEGERNIAAGEALAQEGETLFSEATHMMREGRSLRTKGLGQIEQAQRYREVMAKIHFSERHRQ